MRREQAQLLLLLFQSSEEILGKASSGPPKSGPALSQNRAFGSVTPRSFFDVSFRGRFWN
jgi:hypothetical protein